MERIYIGLALYGSKNECARTHTVFLPISEVCNGTVSLIYDPIDVSNLKVNQPSVYLYFICY